MAVLLPMWFQLRKVRKSAERSGEEEVIWGGTIPSGDPLLALLSVEVEFLCYQEAKNSLSPA